jgi:hypothetical protein
MARRRRSRDIPATPEPTEFVNDVRLHVRAFSRLTSLSSRLRRNVVVCGSAHRDALGLATISFP